MLRRGQRTLCGNGAEELFLTLFPQQMNILGGGKGKRLPPVECWERVVGLRGPLSESPAHSVHAPNQLWPRDAEHQHDTTSLPPFMAVTRRMANAAE